jgi:hypothetical protein
MRAKVTLIGQGKLPPHDEPAERAVLGSVSYGGVRVFALVRGVLSPEAFYSGRNRQIYEACLALADDHRDIDIVSIGEWLRERGWLDRIDGGMGYLTELLTSVAVWSDSRILATANVIRVKAHERSLLALCQKVEAQLYHGVPSDEFPELVHDIEERVHALAAPSLERGFRLQDPADIWAPIAPPDYLVDKLFVRGSLGLIVAYGASLKTWLALALLLATATGSDWLGRFACKLSPACLIDFESGGDEVRRRVHLIANGHGYETPIAGFTFVTMPPMSLADEGFFVALQPLAVRFRLIVIDSLSAGSGGIDENDVRFARPLNRLKALAAESGCVIVLLHHSKKSAPEGKVDAREMVRGSSAIFNAVDVVLGLTRGEDGLFVVRQSKARGGTAVEAFTVRVDDAPPGGVTVTAVDHQEGEEPRRSPSKTLQTAKAGVMTLLAGNHDVKSKSDAFRRLKGNKPALFDAIDELVEHGLVPSARGPAGAAVVPCGRILTVPP